uniref:Uncharacterized protein n=1 Tax=Timema poppense TaxID=170557 RepID=A0A7R9CMX7_TIMPO|nr:unnamed protein product [Timema poppensis]
MESEQSHNEEGRKPQQMDWFCFERNFREVIEELRLKRTLLVDTRAELQLAVMARHDMERSLDRERRDAQATHMQLDLAVKTNRRWEEERAFIKGSASQYRVQLESATRERDALKEQLHNLQTGYVTFKLENTKLQRSVEEQEVHLRCQQELQNNSISLQAKTRTGLDEVKRNIQKLLEDHRLLERQVVAAQEVGTKVQSAMDNFSILEDSQKKETAALEKQLICVNSENTLSVIICCDQWRSVRRWQSSLREMKARLASERESYVLLSSTLEGALKAQAAFQAMTEEAGHKVDKLNTDIQEHQEKHKQLINERNEIKTNLEQTLKKLSTSEDALKEARALLRRPESKEMSTQTQVIQTQDEEIMTEKIQEVIEETEDKLTNELLEECKQRDSIEDINHKEDAQMVVIEEELDSSIVETSTEIKQEVVNLCSQEAGMNEDSKEDLTQIIQPENNVANINNMER